MEGACKESALFHETPTSRGVVFTPIAGTFSFIHSHTHAHNHTRTDARNHSHSLTTKYLLHHFVAWEFLLQLVFEVAHILDIIEQSRGLGNGHVSEQNFQTRLLVPLKEVDLPIMQDVVDLN